MTEGSCDLTGLNYAVFGLGNKTYEHFNAMGKYVDKRLEELGATRIYDLGLGKGGFLKGTSVYLVHGIIPLIFVEVIMRFDHSLFVNG